MTTQLDIFKRLLSHYRSLSLWVGVSSVSIPFVAAFSGVIPPYPDGIEYMTAVLQLVAMVVAFQIFFGAKRSVVSRTVVASSVLVVLLLLGYLFVFSLFAIHVGGEAKFIVVGYECTSRAVQALGAACGEFGLDQLRDAQFNEFSLWTRFSITVVRTALTALWFGFFICLSLLLGTFLVYQDSRTVRAAGAS